MSEIIVRNVNEALSVALRSLKDNFEIRESRNGRVFGFPDPVMTTYLRPYERVLFSPMRDANPVFHLMEALWMLAGRNDVEFPGQIAKQLNNYSDNGKTLHGAYGFRWREYFGYDQLDWIADNLKNDPTCRRQVLTMWDAGRDTEQTGDLYVGSHGGKDVPCNTHIYFECRGGKLNMTVCCRSNDILWGCFGANAVHMSVLLEYMAAKIGRPMGVYRQFSNDLHLYESKFPKMGLMDLSIDVDRNNWYAEGIGTQRLVAEGETIEEFDEDLELFFGDPWDCGTQQFQTDFFNFTVRPMFCAWMAYKLKTQEPDEIIQTASKIQAADWRLATKEWLQRRTSK